MHERAGISSIAMDPRAELVAKNEDHHRDLNDRIEDSYESHAMDWQMDVVCECGRQDCDVFLKVTKAEYEGVRADPRRFVIIRDHLDPEVDVLISEGERFTVVAKREGEAAEVALQTDPRR